MLSSSSLYPSPSEVSYLGQTMLSFEFSTFDLVLSIGMVVLLILFVTTLWKLNPSKENRRSKDEETYDEVYEHEQESRLPQRQPNPPYDSRQSAERTTYQTPQATPKIVVSATAGGTSQESPEPTPMPIENRESPKPAKTTIPAKQNAKSFEEKDCLHHFGYLSGLPRNTPIPGECFGCQKIVDCLVTKRGK